MSKVKVDTVKTDAFTMDYCRFGQGNMPLVILPGISLQRVMGFAEAIAKAYQPLADDFTIYVFERRNEMPPAYTVAEMARDTAAAMHALELGPVCLFGASQGGVIAMEIAIEHPELVRRLALGSTSALVTQDRYRLFEDWIQLAKAGNAAEVYLAFGRAAYPRDVFEQSREQFLEAAKKVTAEDLDRFVIQSRAMMIPDLLSRLERIACPVLVIGSRDDQVLGGDASEQIAERFRNRPDCGLIMYDSYGHVAYDIAPDYKARLLRFFIPDRAD